MKVKLGVCIAVLSIGSAVSLWSWHHAKKTQKPVVLAAVDRPAEPEKTSKNPTETPDALRTEPPAPSHVEASPIAPSAETVNLPPPPDPSIAASDAAIRSFHAKPEPAAPIEDRPPIASTDIAPAPHEDAPAPAPAADNPPSRAALPAMPDVASLSETPERAEASPVVMKVSTPASQPALGTAKTTQHVMAAGETYSSLAEKYLGNAKYAHLIAKANPGKDPRKLFVGSKINIPAAPPEAATKPPANDATATSVKSVRTPALAVPPVPPEHAYKVQPGETWNVLARRFLGDSKRWTELYELNKERAPRNPDGLRAGTVIELPAGVKPTTKPS